MKRLALALILAASGAQAHEFYDWACCSAQDCRPAEPGEIVETTGGWLIVPTGQVLGYRDPKVHVAPDGHFHRCLRDPKDVKSDTLCIYVPMGAS